jgi:hypothetical protein
MTYLPFIYANLRNAYIYALFVPTRAVRSLLEHAQIKQAE